MCAFGATAGVYWILSLVCVWMNGVGGAWGLLLFSSYGYLERDVCSHFDVGFCFDLRCIYTIIYTHIRVFLSLGLDIHITYTHTLEEYQR